MRDVDGAKADELLRQALFTNAFADHFLTDGFAAGHIRVPRAEIRAWAAEKGYSEKLAGALSKLLHDQDGHLKTQHGQGHSLLPDPNEGLLVRNNAGERWRTRCDGQLFIANASDAPIVRMPVKAVEASVTELFDAYVSGRVPAGIYAATEFVPFPDGAEVGLAEKFPAQASDKKIDTLLASLQWYMKVPYLSAGIKKEDIRALFDALPALLARFCEAVKKDAADPDLANRLPKALVAGFASMC